MLSAGARFKKNNLSEGLHSVMAGAADRKFRKKTRVKLIEEPEALQTTVATLIKSVAKSRRNVKAVIDSEPIALETIDGMPDGVMLVDMNGKVVYVNKAFEKLLGYKAKTLIGKSALDLPTYRKSKDKEKARDYLRKVIERSSAKPIDMAGISKNGREIPINFTASVIKDAQGNPQTLVAVIRDISERKHAEEALRDSEELSRGMLEAATTGIYLLQDGQFQYVNRLFEQISGYTSDELIGTFSISYIHPEDRETVRIKAIEVLKGQRSLPYEFRFIRKNSTTIWVMDRVASIQYKGKRSILGTLMDITERKQAEEEVKRYTRQLEALFNIGSTVSQTLNLEELLRNVQDKVLEVMALNMGGIFLLNEQTKVLTLKAQRGMSPEFVKQLGIVHLGDVTFIGQVVKSGKPHIVDDILLNPRLSRGATKKENIKSFAAVPIMAREKILGVMGVGSRTYRAFPDWEVRMLGAIANQIGMAIDNAQLYEHALELAFTDSLTSLYNRRYLMEQIEREFIRAVRSKASLSLVMFDLDGLKSINDRFGHHEGDVFLREVGRIIKVNTRASDVSARWGGDEFMLLAPETDSNSARKIAERIRVQVENFKEKIDGESIGITVSAGIVSYPAHASVVTELLMKADEAMYNAKRGGKNQSCIFTS